MEFISNNLRPLRLSRPRQISKQPVTAARVACSNHRRCPLGCGNWRSISFLLLLLLLCLFLTLLSFSRIRPPRAVLLAGFRDLEPSSRSLCVALSGEAITLTLHQLKHFISSTVIFFTGRRISQRTQKGRGVAGVQVGSMGLRRCWPEVKDAQVLSC